MEFLTDIFGMVCGQGRCFEIDGVALPLCQRCTGLYAAAALTAGWLAITGLWRRGLPSWGVFLTQAALLLAAMFGGTHAIDSGPTWRLVCGLWTGHVAVVWLVTGGQHLRLLAQPVTGRQLRWRRRDKLASIAAVVAIWPAGALWPATVGLRWHLWAGVIVVGAGCLVGAAAYGISGLGWWVILRAGRQPSSCKVQT